MYLKIEFLLTFEKCPNFNFYRIFFLGRENRESSSEDSDECVTDRDFKSKSEESKEEYEVYEQKDASPTFVNSRNEGEKLRKFLNNSDFYDITVRVEEKAYKLHRAVLESRCGYFLSIFQAEYAEAIAKCDGIPECPGKDKEYLLEEVDQSTFEKIIEYIYFDKDIIGRKCFNGTGRVFKAADILKVDDLSKIMNERLKEYALWDLSSLDEVEILNTACGKGQYDDLYLLYLGWHIKCNWPKIYNVSQFCSISWTMLNNILKSPKLRFVDPHNIFDMCSIWVAHDVKNRYSFLSRIAQIINPNCAVNQDEYVTEAVPHLSNRSLQWVRDKLWEILSKVSYNVSPNEDLQKNRTTKLEEIPVFITLIEIDTIVILNIDMDEITSFSILESENSEEPLKSPVIKSATMIDDNLFILLDSHYSIIFQVYNFSLKKSFLLPSRFYASRCDEYTLLNCNNEIYCCLKDHGGMIFKFSMQLNQWMEISKPKFYESHHQYALFTTNGKRLYKMYNKDVASSVFPTKYFVEPYDFEKNVWNSTHNSSWPPSKIMWEPRQLYVANGSDLVASTGTEIVSFNLESKTWRDECKIPRKLHNFYSTLFALCEDKMLLVVNKELYHFSPSNGTWELKKKVPSKYESNEPEKMLVIHRTSAAFTNR